jgi:hypothetical protein
MISKCCSSFGLKKRGANRQKDPNNIVNSSVVKYKDEFEKREKAACEAEKAAADLQVETREQVEAPTQGPVDTVVAAYSKPEGVGQPQVLPFFKNEKLLGELSLLLDPLPQR